MSHIGLILRENNPRHRKVKLFFLVCLTRPAYRTIDLHSLHDLKKELPFPVSLPHKPSMDSLSACSFSTLSSKPEHSWKLVIKTQKGDCF